jgi:hypothetical protein
MNKCLQVFGFSLVFSVAISLAMGRLYLDLYMHRYAPSKVVALDLRASTDKLRESGYSEKEAVHLIKSRLRELTSNNYTIIDSSVVIGADQESLLFIAE